MHTAHSCHGSEEAVAGAPIVPFQACAKMRAIPVPEPCIQSLSFRLFPILVDGPKPGAEILIYPRSEDDQIHRPSLEAY